MECKNRKTTQLIDLFRKFNVCTIKGNHDLTTCSKILFLFYAVKFSPIINFTSPTCAIKYLLGRNINYH